MRIHRRDAAAGGRARSREFKSNMSAYAGIIAYMLSLIIRIPLSKVIGDAGVGLFSPAFEIFTLITLFFSYGISRTMNGLIRYRIKRDQFKSARKVFSMALKLSLLIGIVVGVALAFASSFIADIIVLETMSRWAILAMAPVVVLSALVNVFRGYFNGNGFNGLVAQSQYIEKILMFITAIAGGRMFLDYGGKVAALHHNDITAYAYGALGVVLGMMISELITLIYLMAVYLLYLGTWKRQLSEDSGRRTESSGNIARMLIGNSIPLALIVILSNLFMIIDQRFFNYCMNRSESELSNAQLWGAYYGKFAVLIGIGAALACMSVLGSISKIVNSYEREEYHIMHERIENAVKKLCIAAAPVAIYLAVLADAFVGGLYQGENGQIISLLRQGAVIIIFYGIAYLFGQVMLKTHMMKEFLISLVAAVAIHIAAVFLLVRQGLMGVEGVVYSVIVFTGVLAVSCFILTCRKLNYRQEWLYSVAFPIVSAGISGLVVMLISRLLISTAGEIVTIIVSSLVGLVLYILLLIVLRVLNEAELNRLPLGAVWIAIGRMIGVL
ncbi:MAG: oligosaccharide flippase family protein [Clostridiales bacterium]|nr:oligosaccharide flippase family protein [Clostridiales bacterium]